jgi:antitoxin ParD1/3/4
MNVSLTKDLEQLISRKVKSGLYQTASEVVREGLRLLDERDRLYQLRLKDLRKEIRTGVDQLDRGEGRPQAGASLGRARAGSRTESEAAATDPGRGGARHRALDPPDLFENRARAVPQARPCLPLLDGQLEPECAKDLHASRGVLSGTGRVPASMSFNGRLTKK